MKEVILQTYGIVLPIVLGYIVWLLKEQKKRQQKDAIERNKRIADETEKRDANSAGTMLLLRVQLSAYLKFMWDSTNNKPSVKIAMSSGNAYLGKFVKYDDFTSSEKTGYSAFICGGCAPMP